MLFEYEKDKERQRRQYLDILVGRENVLPGRNNHWRSLRRLESVNDRTNNTKQHLTQSRKDHQSTIAPQERNWRR